MSGGHGAPAGAPKPCVLRPAAESDLERVLVWRNQPHVRAAMVNREPIAEADHRRWWAAMREDPARRLLILERGGTAIAVLTFFGLSAREGWWGFYLTDAVPRDGGERLAAWFDAESAALRYAFEVLGLDRLLCETRHENTPVLALHERFGFTDLPSEHFPHARAHGLVVKELTRAAYAATARAELTEAVAAMPLPDDPFRDVPAGPDADLLFVGSANWDEVALAFGRVWREAFGDPLTSAAAPFGRGFLSLLDPASRLRRDPPRYVVFAERFEDFLPACDTPVAATVEQAMARFDSYLETLRTLRAALPCRFLVHDLRPVRPRPRSLRDAAWGEDPVARAAAEMNARLRAFCEESRDTWLLPVGAVVADIGEAAADPGKYWLLGRFPFGPAFTPAYGRMLAGALAALSQRTARAVVLDLDNTIWGGVVGDDGVENLALGPDYPGNQFVAFQKFVATLADRGVLLAVSSKNTEEVALDALRRHPEMVLREDAFITRRIGWDAKSGAVSEIAEELGLGLGSILFVDDNPLERAEVRAGCPGVIVPEMPADVAEWPGFLARHPALAVVEVLAEDRDKVEKYRIRRRIETARTQAPDMTSFLRDLRLEVGIGPIVPMTRARTLQLFAKTNQFNTTGRRYDEAELEQILAEGGEVLTVRIRDRFGSDEIVAAAVLRHGGAGGSEIENVVMSCRVLGRGVETAVLADLAARARRRGAEALIGRIVETPRNAPCRDLYRRHHFVEVDAGAYRLALTGGEASAGPAWPEWIAPIEDAMPIVMAVNS